MSQTKGLTIIAQLLTNAADLRDGVVTVTARFRDSRIVEVNYFTTESKQEKELEALNLQETRISGAS